MYESGLSQNKEARRWRNRRAESAQQWRRANKINITPSTPIKSLSEILCSIWHRQERGWVVIRAYCRGPNRKCEQLWARSDKITPKQLERWLNDHRAWHVEFCPVTFARNWQHLGWRLFDWGEINRRERLSYLEYGPLERTEKLGREPDILIEDEDKGIWLTEHGDYIDFPSRDGLFIWLPTHQLNAHELIGLYHVPVRKYLGQCNEGKRSDVIWRIGKECVLKGMRDPDDIKTIIRASTAYQSRLADRGERQAERGLDYDVRKLLREAQ